MTCTSTALVDLAAVLTIDELESALAVTRRRKLATDAEIRASDRARALAKGRRQPQRAAHGRDRQPRLTRSKYERKLLQLIAAAQLPMPIPNVKVEGHEVDLFWPEQRLIVEFDGFAFHSDRKAFENDRLRDQRLTAAGYRVLRVTARQIDTTPEAVIARIAQALTH